MPKGTTVEASDTGVYEAILGILVSFFGEISFIFGEKI